MPTGVSEQRPGNRCSTGCPFQNRGAECVLSGLPPVRVRRTPLAVLRFALRIADAGLEYPAVPSCRPFHQDSLGLTMFEPLAPDFPLPDRVPIFAFRSLNP